MSVRVTLLARLDSDAVFDGDDGRGHPKHTWAAFTPESWEFAFGPCSQIKTWIDDEEETIHDAADQYIGRRRVYVRKTLAATHVPEIGAVIYYGQSKVPLTATKFFWSEDLQSVLIHLSCATEGPHVRKGALTMLDPGWDVLAVIPQPEFKPPADDPIPF